MKDGHLFAGGKRFRIFGVNMAFGANFPTHEAAEKVAGRLAKFGINCVRFHHMDMFSAPAGIFAKDGVALDPERFDRLDYFIAQLKARGIYADLNLHVSRTYPDRPKAEKQGSENYDKGVDNFSAQQIALQKDFARDLLTHVNPYTKTAYAQEPAVALIEINNENALLFSWQNGALDKAAAPYRAELGELWTKWLTEKYGSDERSPRRGARARNRPDRDCCAMAASPAAWMAGGSSSTKAPPPTASLADGVRVEVKTPGKEGWHGSATSRAQSRKRRPVELSFRARADAPRKANVAVSQAHEPWQVPRAKLRPHARVEDIQFVRKRSAGDDDARVSLASATRRAGLNSTTFCSTPPGSTGRCPRKDKASLRSQSPTTSAAPTGAARLAPLSCGRLRSDTGRVCMRSFAKS